MIVSQPSDDLNRSIDPLSSSEIIKSLSWKAEMYWRIWTRAGRQEVWGSRRLAETFVLRDRKQAHALAEELEAQGPATLEPPGDNANPWEGCIYRLVAERPISPTTDIPYVFSTS